MNLIDKNKSDIFIHGIYSDCSCIYSMFMKFLNCEKQRARRVFSFWDFERDVKSCQGCPSCGLLWLYNWLESCT